MEAFEREIYKHYFQVGGFRPMPNQTKTVDLDFLLENYEAFFFDAFGTFYCRDNFLYPGAVAMYQKVRQNGKPMRLVTNAASSAIEKMVEHLAQLKIPFAASEIISSGTLFENLAKEQKIREAFYIGKEDGKAHLMQAGVSISDSPKENTVIISSQGKSEFIWENALRILQKPNAKLIVLNPDAWAPRNNGNREGVSGCYAHRLFLETHPQVFYLGKPFREIFEKAKNSLPQKMKIIMIGDTLATDIGGAMNAGIDAAILLGRNQPEKEFQADSEFLQVQPKYILQLRDDATAIKI